MHSIQPKNSSSSYMTVIRGLSAGFFVDVTLTVDGTVVDSDPKSSKSPIPA